MLKTIICSQIAKWKHQLFLDQNVVIVHKS
jgi:hypothetical protein